METYLIFFIKASNSFLFFIFNKKNQMFNSNFLDY